MTPRYLLIEGVLAAFDQGCGCCLTLPLLFRLLLYGCGLRPSEVLSLRLANVDLETGVLTIRDAKFHKDRLVPIAEVIRPLRSIPIP